MTTVPSPSFFDAIRTAGRVGVGFLLIFIPLVLAKTVVLPALGLRSGGEPTDVITSNPVEFVATIGSSIAAALGGYWVFVKWVEKRRAPELAFNGKTVVFGLVSGIAAIGLPILLLYAAGYYTVEDMPGVRIETLAIVSVVASIVLFEEIVFRGLIFGVVEDTYGARVALIVQAVLFAAAHVFNDNWSGIMPLVSTVLIGLLWGALYLIYRNLWMMTLHHAAWNLTIFSLGLPLSGITDWRAFAPLKSNFAGPELLTGGLGGPELSIATPLFTVLLLGFLYARFKGRQPVDL